MMKQVIHNTGAIYDLMKVLPLKFQIIGEGGFIKDKDDNIILYIDQKTDLSKKYLEAIIELVNLNTAATISAMEGLDEEAQLVNEILSDVSKLDTTEYKLASIANRALTQKRIKQIQIEALCYTTNINDNANAGLGRLVNETKKELAQVKADYDRVEKALAQIILSSKANPDGDFSGCILNLHRIIMEKFGDPDELLKQASVDYASTIRKMNDMYLEHALQVTNSSEKPTAKAGKQIKPLNDFAIRAVITPDPTTFGDKIVLKDIPISHHNFLEKLRHEKEIEKKILENMKSVHVVYAPGDAEATQNFLDETRDNMDIEDKK